MKKYNGGTEVKAGLYWNPARWEIVTLPNRGGALPGGSEEHYFRVPGVLLLLLAPVIGGVYVVFLPFIGFAMVFTLAAKKAAGALRTVFAELVTTLSPAWQPGEAYFVGKGKPRKEEEKGAATKRDEPLETIQKEIEAKRREA